MSNTNKNEKVVIDNEYMTTDLNGDIWKVIEKRVIE